MATHVHIRPARKFRRTKFVVIGAAATLVMGLIGVTPSFAAQPTDPTTSQGAEQAWQASSAQAETAAEDLDGAQAAQATARTAATKATADLATAQTALTTAQQKAAATAATVVTYQAQLDAFTNASYRGVQLGDMSALLTAKTADDFLDQASSIDQIAADTQKTLTAALAAKATAATDQTAANAAEIAASIAKTNADTASTAATAAATAAQTKKTALDAAVTKYKNLYSKLSAQEQAAAAAAIAKERAQSQTQAQAAIAAAQVNAAAAAPAAVAQSSSAATAPNASSSAASNSAASSSAAAAAAITGGDKQGEIAAAAAMTKIGLSYCYACNGPNSYDCSGLTTWAWAQAGIAIPRTSSQQSHFPSVPLSQLQPGDLVTYFSPVHHVAIYVGNGMVVSAADEALGIVYVPVARGGALPTGHRVPRS